MIVAAAITKDGKIWTLPKPARHHDIISVIHGETGKQVCGDYTQGFVDENGKFFNRYQARIHAIKSGQIEKARWGLDLFSEDLW